MAKSLLDMAVEGGKPLVPDNLRLATIPVASKTQNQEDSESETQEGEGTEDADLTSEDSTDKTRTEEKQKGDDKVAIKVNGQVKLVHPSVAAEMDRLRGNAGTQDSRNNKLSREVQELREAVDSRNGRQKEETNGAEFKAPALSAELATASQALDSHLSALDPDMQGKLTTLMDAVYQSAITAAHSVNHAENQALLTYFEGKFEGMDEPLAQAGRLNDMFEIQSAVGRSGENVDAGTVREIREILREDALDHGSDQSDVDSVYGRKYLLGEAIKQAVIVAQEEANDGGAKRKITPKRETVEEGNQLSIRDIVEASGGDVSIVDQLLNIKKPGRRSAGSVDPRRLRMSAASKMAAGAEDEEYASSDANVLVMKKLGLRRG